MLQRILHQSLAFGVECRRGLVENQYGRILQYGTGNAHPLPLPSREPAATIADVGVVALFRLHNEVVGVGNARRLLHLLQGGVVHTEGYVVAERVVEKDGLLVDIAYQRAQVVQPEVFHVHAVDEHLALLHVVISRDEVNQCRFAAAALPHQGYGLALLDGEVHVSEHPFLAIAKRHVAQLYLVVETAHMHRMFALPDVALCHEYLVHTLHRRQSLGDVVAGLGKILKRVDDAVENNHVVDERGAAQRAAAQHQRAAKPQHDDNHHRAEKFAHGVRHLLAGVHPAYVLAVG